MTTVGILGKLYANSALTVLNSRPPMGEKGRDLSEVSTFNAGPRLEPNTQSTFQMTTRTAITERGSFSSAKSSSEVCFSFTPQIESADDSTQEPFPKNDNKLKEA